MGLTWAGFLARLLSVQPPHLGLDGDFSLTLARVPLAEMLEITAKDTHPPLYYVLLRVWTELAGSSALGAQYVGVALATASIPLLGVVARKLASPRAGLLAAFLLASSALHLQLSVTVRDFAPALFFQTLALWLFLSVVQVANRRPRVVQAAWLGWILSSVAALYMSYLSVGPLLAELAYGLLRASRERRHKTLRAWLLSAPLIGAGFAPWIAFVLVARLRTGVGVLTPPSAHPSPPYSALDVWNGHASLSIQYLLSLDYVPVPPWTASLGLAALALGAWYLASRSPRRAPAMRPSALIVTGLAVSLLLAWLLALGSVSGYLGRRHTIAALPFFILLVTHLILVVGAWRRSALLPLLGVLMAISLTSHLAYLRSPPEWENPDLTTDMEALSRQQIGDDDHAVFTSPIYAGSYQAWFGDRRSWSLIMVDPFKPALTTDVAMASDRLLTSIPPDRRALWLFLYGGVRPDNQPLVSHLAAQAFPAGHAWLVGTQVNVYALPRQPMQEHTIEALFEEGVSAVGTAITPEAAPGGTINVALRWRTEARLPRDYKVFAHLLDTEGHRWAQHDEEPADGEAPTSAWQPGETVHDNHGLLLPSNIPPGPYDLVVGLYDPAPRPMRRLRLLSGGDLLLVGTVAVRDSR